MLRADRDSARRALTGGTVSSETVILWLPTFRAAAWETVTGRQTRLVVPDPGPSLLFPERDLREVDAWLVANNARIVVKAHPLAAADLQGNYDAIKLLSHRDLAKCGLTVYQAMTGSDCLITDVSSVWQDYLLLDRPVIIAFPDIDRYRSSRGINLEPYEEWIPGPLVTETSSLLDCLDKVVHSGDINAERRHSARRRMHRYTDGKSTERLLDLLALAGR
jgi:CDP-glycerol glycerophosphotransferase (TagB/SpsB family)